MSTGRRTVLGAALAAPLLGEFTGTASAAADSRYGTLSDGWVEIRWAEPVQAELDRLGAGIEVLAPARLVRDARGTALRFPVRSGQGDPALTRLPRAEGAGTLDGGFTVRTPAVSVRVTGLRGALRDGVVSAWFTVGGAEAGYRAALRCGLDEGLLSTGDAPAGRPLRVRVGEVPLRPTAEALEAYAAAFGATRFTTDTVVGHVTAEGVYTPPRP